MAEAWRLQRADIAVQARRLVEAVGSSARIEPSAEPLTTDLLAEAERGIARTFEPTYGGFGRAPKFPPASTLEFLLRRGSPTALEMVTKTLDGMAAGGMYDLVGGGFHRYSVDDRWLVPHFEKMLYDNALLASAYLHAWVVTGEPRYRAVVEETLDYVVRELRLPDGGLASAQDADTNGVEGLTFTWTEDEGVPAELLLPFEDGRSIIRGDLPPDLRARLFAQRALRPQPGLDDKVLASWNGLALAALAEGARRLERADWLDAASRAGRVPARPALARERTALALVARGKGERRGIPRRLRKRGARTDRAPRRDRRDPLARGGATARRCSRSSSSTTPSRAGSFLRPTGGEELVARTKGLDDNPIPSGNSMLAHVLLRLGRIWGDDELGSAGRFRAPARGADAAAGHPVPSAGRLCALDLWLAPPREIAIVGPVDSPVARAALAPFAPNTVVAVGPAAGIPLLEGKGLVDGKPAVYVCERFVCRAPVTDPAEL